MSNGRPQHDDVISAFHDGELAAHERHQVEQLLEESADARAEYDDYRALSELLRSMPAERAPDGLRSAVMRRLEQESLFAAPAKPTGRAPRKLRPRVLTFAGGLAAAAVLLIAVVVRHRGADLPRDVQLAQDETNAASEVAASAGNSAPDATLSAEPAAPTIALTTSSPSGLIGAAEDMASAGPAARPPDGFSVGDVYTYLEQTPDGDVMVVNAVVVDVRRALSQMQVLLSQSEIPTMPVAATDAQRGGFGGGFVEEERDQASSPTTDMPVGRLQDFALYVETDPARMNAALSRLGDQQEVLEWKYAGVINESDDATSPRYFLPSDDGQGAQLSKKVLDMEEKQSIAGSGSGVARGQARASIVDESGRNAPVEATQAILPDLQRRAGREMPLQSDSKASEPAAESSGMAAPQNEFADQLDNGYQTVVTVPRGTLEETLTRSSGPPSPAGGREYFSRNDPAESRDRTVQPESPPVRRLEETVRQQVPAAKGVQPQQRRLRLLVVLQPEPAVGKALKADAVQQQPVEAPVPARKKG